MTFILPWLLKNWLPASVGLGLFLVVMLILGQRAEIAHLHKAVDKATQAAASAQAQSNLTSNITAAVDRAATKEVAITTQTERAVDVVHEAPGATDALPPAVASAWAAGIDGLRPAAPASPTDGDHTSKP